MTLKSHYAHMESMAFSPDGTKVLTGSGHLQLWEIASGKQLSAFRFNFVSTIVFCPDGSKVLIYDGRIVLLETTNWSELVSLKGDGNRLRTTVFSPNGEFVIACDENGMVLLWRVTGSEMGRLLGVYTATNQVMAVYWQDATHIVLADTGGARGQPRFYQLELKGMDTPDG